MIFFRFLHNLWPHNIGVNRVDERIPAKSGKSVIVQTLIFLNDPTFCSIETIYVANCVQKTGKKDYFSHFRFFYVNVVDIKQWVLTKRIAAWRWVLTKRNLGRNRGFKKLPRNAAASLYL